MLLRIMNRWTSFPAMASNFATAASSRFTQKRLSPTFAVDTRSIYAIVGPVKPLGAVQGVEPRGLGVGVINQADLARSTGVQPYKARYGYSRRLAGGPSMRRAVTRI